MHSQNPPALPQAPSERQIRKRFTWDSMRKKEPAVPSTNASTTNTANGLSRAQTSLANYNSSSGLVKEKISAYNLRWADLRFYLQKLFEHSNLDYTNKHEDVSSFPSSTGYKNNLFDMEVNVGYSCCKGQLLRLPSSAPVRGKNQAPHMQVPCLFILCI